ncbi:hypothetical protein HK096_007646 [Nowakowskiella sp. JEL0078]|nr:hypothetical protein HK096_007646 [Nowakowskiella sp. JEL0078]
MENAWDQQSFFCPPFPHPRVSKFEFGIREANLHKQCQRKLPPLPGHVALRSPPNEAAGRGWIAGNEFRGITIEDPDYLSKLDEKQLFRTSQQVGDPDVMKRDAKIQIVDIEESDKQTKWLRMSRKNLFLKMENPPKIVKAVGEPPKNRTASSLGYFRIFTEMKTVNTNGYKSQLLPYKYNKKVPLYGSSPRLLLISGEDDDQILATSQHSIYDLTSSEMKRKLAAERARMAMLYRRTSRNHAEREHQFKALNLTQQAKSIILETTTLLPRIYESQIIIQSKTRTKECNDTTEENDLLFADGLSEWETRDNKTPVPLSHNRDSSRRAANDRRNKVMRETFAHNGIANIDDMQRLQRRYGDEHRERDERDLMLEKRRHNIEAAMRIFSVKAGSEAKGKNFNGKRYTSLKGRKGWEMDHLAELALQTGSSMKKDLRKLVVGLFGKSQTVGIIEMRAILNEVFIDSGGLSSSEIEYLKMIFEIENDDVINLEYFCVIAQLADCMVSLNFEQRKYFYEKDISELEKNIRQHKNLYTVFSDATSLNQNFNLIKPSHQLHVVEIKNQLKSAGLLEGEISDILNFLSLQKSGTLLTDADTIDYFRFLSFLPFFVRLHETIVTTVLSEDSKEAARPMFEPEVAEARSKKIYEKLMQIEKLQEIVEEIQNSNNNENISIQREDIIRLAEVEQKEIEPIEQVQKKEFLIREDQV